ncbi:haloacid dehalogenase-like hydrolase [Actinocorallia sp. API 0066]|uniref:HAD family hydrolase n=1 Tax=Actinocorallia sp. API 0066 TaxID=2896846 RepID=UPI001E323A70|nr:haloacid dehalogenase-like hydrolase [Actinocorallia sp. API 0066]MCD0447679.1 haloacid dehalogenase-like hydrolase [Actinocorallia sp. API 0066]
MMVGFDLDMTLADTRRGIGAVYAALSAETGVFIDVPLVTSRLGPPLEAELAHWFPAERVPEMVVRFRALYPDLAIPATDPMAGAAEAVQAVRDGGDRVIVVTAKNRPHAEATLRHLGLEVDLLVGGLWSAAKGEALREHGAHTYVGDHTGDVDAARAAGAFSLAVATGPFTAEALAAYGADHVLGDLTTFPSWFSARGTGKGTGRGTFAL